MHDTVHNLQHDRRKQSKRNCCQYRSFVQALASCDDREGATDDSQEDTEGCVFGSLERSSAGVVDVAQQEVLYVITALLLAGEMMM